MGELEQAVMDKLWSAASPMTVREVHESLSAERTLAYTTVMTVLDRLAKKELVSQERDGRAFKYAPSQSREHLTAGLMLDALGQSDDPGARMMALQHFVGQMSPQEAAAIRAALSDS